MAVVNAADLIPEWIEDMKTQSKIHDELKKLSDVRYELEWKIQYIKHLVPYVEGQRENNLILLEQTIDASLETVIESQKALSELQRLLIYQSLERENRWRR